MQLRDYQIKASQEALDALHANNDPVLLEMSVGGGKSIVISFLIKHFEQQGKYILSLVNSAELVRNNSNEYKGDYSIFCASLNRKEYNHPVIFATPQSIMSALNINHPIAQLKFDLIVVDEAHSINHKKDTSLFMRILRHYKQTNSHMKLIGLTGTGFRGLERITGKNALFKTQVGNISTQYLIDRNYLVKPVFGHQTTESFDFSKCKPQRTGEFKNADLQAVIDSKHRLTYQILQEVQLIMKSRTVCMIFCSTKAHCFEALEGLPKHESAIILGDTEDSCRNDILAKARSAEIKYLISINCLLTGVNITCIDLLVWLRPTSSLLLYIQGIGRGLRLHPGKKNCLVLDYAQNIETFQDIDNPILNDAIQPTTKTQDEYIIPCYTCSTLNKTLARRCCGIVNNKRCDYYFDWKDCHQCSAKNDITARICRACQAELIDPNSKLRLLPNQTIVTVEKIQYHVSPMAFSIYYNSHILEQYQLKSRQGINIFYAKFVRQCAEKPSAWYMHLTNFEKLQEMCSNLKEPKYLLLEDGKIKKKVFS